MRMNLGARREDSTLPGRGPNSLTCRGDPVVMLVDAPGDVAAVCRFMIWWTTSKKIPLQPSKTMSSPPLRGSVEWSARREAVLLLELAGGNRRRAQWLWLQKERMKAEASQLASAKSPQASQQPAGSQAEPATARAQGVPKPKKSAARLAKDRRRLNQ